MLYTPHFDVFNTTTLDFSLNCTGIFVWIPQVNSSVCCVKLQLLIAMFLMPPHGCYVWPVNLFCHRRHSCCFSVKMILSLTLHWWGIMYSSFTWCCETVSASNSCCSTAIRKGPSLCLWLQRDCKAVRWNDAICSSQTMSDVTVACLEQCVVYGARVWLWGAAGVASVSRAQQLPSTGSSFPRATCSWPELSHVWYSFSCFRMSLGIVGLHSCNSV